jgi:ABC-type lipoprotein export system ATPase subunit
MGEAEVHALRGVDLEIRAGEFIVLLGPSGSGKSTLLNLLGGLDTPTSGSIRFKDQDLSGAAEADLTRYRREHVGFVFQFYNLIPALTARENVELVSDIAASSSASPSRARSPSAPPCSCATSRPARSTTRPASWCSRSSRRSTPSSAPPPW